MSPDQVLAESPLWLAIREVRRRGLLGRLRAAEGAVGAVPADDAIREAHAKETERLADG